MAKVINYERKLARFRDGGARAEPEVDRLAALFIVQEKKRELSAQVFDDARAIFSEKEEFFARSIPVSHTCWIMSKISTMVVLSAPVSILNPNPMYLPLPLGVLHFNQSVPLLISYNIITFLVFYSFRLLAPIAVWCDGTIIVYYYYHPVISSYLKKNLNASKPSN